MKKTLISIVKADQETKSGRIYPKEILEKLANDPALQLRIRSSELWGGIYDNKLMRKIGPDTHAVTALRFNGESIEVDLELISDIDINDNPIILYTVPMSAPDHGIIDQATRIHSIHVERKDGKGNNS